MNSTWKIRKLVSKFHRIALSEHLRSVLLSLPIQDLEESQVGNYIYSGNGKLTFGNTSTPATIRVKMVDGETSLHIRAPSVGINIACALSIDAAKQAVHRAMVRSLN